MAFMYSNVAVSLGLVSPLALSLDTLLEFSKNWMVHELTAKGP